MKTNIQTGTDLTTGRAVVVMVGCLFFAGIALFWLAIFFNLVPNANAATDKIKALESLRRIHPLQVEALNTAKTTLCETERSISLIILERNGGLSREEKRCFADKAAWMCPENYQPNISCEGFQQEGK